MPHHVLRTCSVILAGSCLLRRGLGDAYAGRAALVLDLALVLLGGLLAFLLFPGAAE